MAKAAGSACRIEPLGSHHDRTAFSCGVEALDRCIRTQAGQDTRKRVASCFVLTDEAGSLAGYYTLSATSIALADLPPELREEAASLSNHFRDADVAPCRRSSPTRPEAR
jgi:hypothetical protein